MSNRQILGTLSILTWALASGVASHARAADNENLVAPDSASSPPGTQRAPVPFERKVPITARPTAPDIVSHSRQSRSGIESTDGLESTDPDSRSEIDLRAAKAAVEADGYKRVTILGRGPNGTWRAKGYRGDMEVGLTVDADGDVTTK